MGERLIKIAADDLEARAKNTLRENSDDLDDEEGSTAKSEEAENNRIENDFGGALKTIKSLSFVNVKNVASSILKKEDISSCEYLYTKMLLTGMCDKNMKYVMIDEVQDYTMAQLLVFKKYFPNARFMLLGDEFQSIRKGTVTFKEIEERWKEVCSSSTYDKL